MAAVVTPAASVIAALVLIALLVRNPAPFARLRLVVLVPWWLAGLVLRWIPGLWWLPQLMRWIPPMLLLRAPEIFVDQWRAIDAETVRDPADAGRANLQVLVLLVTVAASLTLQEYLGGHDSYERLFPADGSRYWELRSFAWWSGWRVFGYVGIPMIVLACLPGQRIRDYHVSLRGFFHHLWIYAALFALVLPAVIYASTTVAFRETYPFYRIANRSYTDLALWELLYAAQFLSLEFFFRGFLLHGLRRALGANAIYVMLVPYCMIHYGKPLPETLGAIGAGLILGTLAMRTRSIWGGVLIHVGVATTMDVLALRGCPPFGGAPCH
ncbi:MAG TPA: CPBP family intramembrane glutamic endopeptidase [Kofleriaceae bacterium]